MKTCSVKSNYQWKYVIISVGLAVIICSTFIYLKYQKSKVQIESVAKNNLNITSTTSSKNIENFVDFGDESQDFGLRPNFFVKKKKEETGTTLNTTNQKTKVQNTTTTMQHTQGESTSSNISTTTTTTNKPETTKESDTSTTTTKKESTTQTPTTQTTTTTKETSTTDSGNTTS